MLLKCFSYVENGKKRFYIQKVLLIVLSFMAVATLLIFYRI